jgi:predicted esterase
MILHDRQRVLHGGAPLSQARVAVVLIHGRGASAEDIFGLGEDVADGSSEVALLAPQAAGNTWYPERFLAPVVRNEPHLTSALGVIANLVAEAAESRIRFDKIIVAGFSQGACLALEYAARNPRRYGGIVGLSGALIGPPGTERRATGSLGGTPVYLGCDAEDAHIPLPSVEESALILGKLGGTVTKSIFTDLGHSVNLEEIEAFKSILKGALSGT